MMKLTIKKNAGLPLAFALAMAGACLLAQAQQASETPRPQSPQITNPVKDSSAKDMPDKDLTDSVSPKIIPMFAQVTPTLFRGAQPKKEGFTELAKMGINIVVDLRGDRDSEREIVNGLGMEYVPLHWQCSFPRDRTMAKFLTLLRENPGKKVFVHCRVGDDRTGMMIAAYRMAEEGWTPERALDEMKIFNFNFAHRRLICPGLSHYEEHFMERFQTKPGFESLRSKEHPPVPEQPPSSEPPQPSVPSQPPSPGQPPSPQASGRAL